MVMRSTALLLGLMLFAGTSSAEDGDRMDVYDMLDLVGDMTVECRQEKDQRLCVNYFSEDGVFVQVMHDDGERKEGVWFVEDHDQLCILWKGKVRPLCFAVYAQQDGSYTMIRREKHVSTMLRFEDGNSKGL